MPLGRTWVSINSAAVAGHGFPERVHHRPHVLQIPFKQTIDPIDFNNKHASFSVVPDVVIIVDDVNETL